MTQLNLIVNSLPRELAEFSLFLIIKPCIAQPIETTCSGLILQIGFLLKKDFKREFFYNLEVGFNTKNYLFQVNDHPKPPKIFNNYYPFFTNKSKFMVQHFKNYFKWITRQKKLNKFF